MRAASRPGDQVPDLPRLQRLGRSCARHHFVVLACWLVALVAVVVGSKTAGGAFSDNVSLSGTESSTAAALLAAHDPTISGSTGLVVFHTLKGTLAADYQKQVDQVVTDLSRLQDVLSASNPLSAASPSLSRSGTIAYSTVHLSVNPKLLGTAFVEALDMATRPLRAAGVEVEYGGGFDSITRPRAVDTKAEIIGLGVALVVLLVGFGSLLGAVLPLAGAVLAVLVGVSLLGIAAAALTFGTASPTLALMIGLGVGIDYAVFLTTRYRQRIIDGWPPDVAAGAAASTAGHSVLVAAATVSVALLGLYATGIVFLGQLGLAALFGVFSAACAAVTLVPSLLGLAGRRVDSVGLGTPVAESGRDDDNWHRYAAAIGRRPWWFLAGGVGVLVVLAIPLFSIRLGHVDDGADPSSFTDKRAYDLIASGFGSGANGPFTVVVRLGNGSGASSIATTLSSELRAQRDVAGMSQLSPTTDGTLLVGTLVPSSSPQSVASAALFHHLVDVTLPQALRGTGATGYVTGPLAENIQFADTLGSRLVIVIAVVVLTALLLVMTAFRGLLLAVKAAVLNLLSIAAAYGVVVAVFQWGWGRSLLGVSENVPIESYVPVMMFAIVFGLSMDYEVFLLARVKESWERTHDHPRSVATGLSATGRVISCAALIMISVFASFVTSSQVVIKMLAVGLSASVLIDATVVRLLLVPAAMYLLGERSWWIPRWLDRILPRIDAEGSERLGRLVPSGEGGREPAAPVSI